MTIGGLHLLSMQMDWPLTPFDFRYLLLCLSLDLGLVLEAGGS